MSEESYGEYLVVFKTLAGPARGTVSWAAFDDEEAFEAFYASDMEDDSGRKVSDVYDVIEKGVSEEVAIHHVRMHSPEYSYSSPSFG
ncbi:MAG: hypothetical protein QF692_00430 [Alphaproteobacteria bacterium]|jgi:hypothetical protein|nr:hypothetical protein [Alphaproteobacteria bacterium]MDP7221713.1 hypothetical protein [Alphaproteobacteria bacterium]